MRTRKRNRTDRFFETLPNSINLIDPSKQPLKVKMDKVNGIDMEFVLKNGAFPLEPIDYAWSGTVFSSRRRCEMLGKGQENE